MARLSVAPSARALPSARLRPHTLRRRGLRHVRGVQIPGAPWLRSGAAAATLTAPWLAAAMPSRYQAWRSSGSWARPPPAARRSSASSSQPAACSSAAGGDDDDAQRPRRWHGRRRRGWTRASWRGSREVPGTSSRLAARSLCCLLREICASRCLSVVDPSLLPPGDTRSVGARSAQLESDRVTLAPCAPCGCSFATLPVSVRRTARRPSAARPGRGVGWHLAAFQLRRGALYKWNLSTPFAPPSPLSAMGKAKAKAVPAAFPASKRASDDVKGKAKAQQAPAPKAAARPSGERTGDALSPVELELLRQFDFNTVRRARRGAVGPPSPPLLVAAAHGARRTAHGAPRALAPPPPRGAGGLQRVRLTHALLVPPPPSPGVRPVPGHLSPGPLQARRGTPQARRLAVAAAHPRAGDFGGAAAARRQAPAVRVRDDGLRPEAGWTGEAAGA